MTVKLFKNGILSPGFRILSQYEGREYQIIFPTGAILYVDRSAIKGLNFINLWLKPAPVDHGQTQGLCGMYDGNVTNDLTFPNKTVYNTDLNQPNDYSLTWRVNPQDTLYTGSCDNGNMLEKQSSFCYCDSSEKCGDGYDLVICPFLERDQIDFTAQLEARAVYPLKCLDQLNYDSTTFPLFEYNQNYKPEFINTSLTSPSGFTYKAVTVLAEGILESDNIALTCKDISAVRMYAVKESLIYDMFETGQYIWSKAAVQSIQTQCEIELERNTSLWEGDPKAPPTSYTSLFCIAECGATGTCTQGVCSCNSGYGGSDCFVETNLPPNLFGLANGGLCDTRDEECSTVVLYVNNTVNVPELACYVTKLMSNASGTYNLLGSLSALTKSNATFLTVNEVQCSLPEAGTFQVQIATNENSLSAPAFVIVYDSQCMDCFTSNTTCTQKTSTCLINNLCYEDGEFNPNSVREFCNSSISVTTWQVAKDSCRGLPVMWLKEKGYISGGQSQNGDTSFCKELCADSDGCLSFDFNSTSNECSLNTEDSALLIDSSTYNYEWICENYPCQMRNITWKNKPGFAFVKTQDKPKVTSSINECRRYCLEEKKFTCRSIQLLRDAKLCYLSALTSLTAGSGLVRWPGYVFEEWNCNTETEIALPTANPEAVIAQKDTLSQDIYTLFCKFNISNSGTIYQANVKFLIEDEVVERKTIFTNKENNTYWVGMDPGRLINLKYGAQLSCGVSLCVNGSCEATIGGFRKSQVLSLSVTVTSPAALLVQEGQPGKNITIHSNFPPAFLCDSFNSTSACTLNIKLRCMVSNSSEYRGHEIYE
ncbi:uncharacterized protein LOC131943152 [Physella acuta]|uniref:uncharacterized protein LOC131943152 n=1 Tax=Physella acuta TaxID=109671 RepID=UPI0027DC81A6|nr:uncharacterized protein LOC131943152 [Physella acuta]